MSESILNIPIPGTELEVQGVFRDAGPNAPLVVFVHGFTGYRDEHQFFNGARAVEKAGFSSYRFNLYASDLKARKFLDCAVATHVGDLDLVVRTLKRRATHGPITVIGHSLGGIVTLSSEEKAFDAAILWDPAAPRNAADEGAVWFEALGCWVVPGNVDMLVGADLMKSWAESDVLKRALSFEIPTKVIAAGGGILKDVGLEYANAIPAEHEYVVVPEADHCFYKGETATELFAETVAWLKKYGR